MNQYNLEFWTKRIKESLDNGGSIRDAICSNGPWYWDRINDKAKSVLSKYVLPSDSVIDMACGCGDLYGCVPEGCNYLGLDFVPEFIGEARRRYPSGLFEVFSIFDLSRFTNSSADVVIGRGVVDDVVYGRGEWEGRGILPELKRIARRTIVLLSFADPMVYHVIEKGS